MQRSRDSSQGTQAAFRLYPAAGENDEDAEDILQDVFYQLVNNYRIDGTDRKGYIVVIHVARNRITGPLQKEKNRRLFKPCPALLDGSDDEASTISLMS
jgi:hypothetical protein